MHTFTVSLPQSSFRKLTELAADSTPKTEPELLAARLLASAIEDLSETISEPAKPKTKT